MHTMFSRHGAEREVPTRELLALLVLALGVVPHFAWPSLGRPLSQVVETQAARLASHSLDVAGINHLLDVEESQILLPLRRFDAAAASWVFAFAFTVAYLILTWRGITRGILLLLSVPLWCGLAGAATLFAVAFGDAGPSDVSTFGARLAHGLVIVVLVLAFDQLLHVLWFIQRFVITCVVRGFRAAIGVVLWCYAQCLRLLSSERGKRNQTRVSSRARELFRRPQRDRFRRGAAYSESTRSSRSEKATARRSTSAGQSSRRSQNRYHRRKSNRLVPRWWKTLSRNWLTALQKYASLRLLLALPAIGLLIAIAFAELRWSEIRQGQLILRYRQAAQTAFDADDLEAADLFYRRLGEFDDHRDEASYGKALIVERRGDQEESRKLMEKIAPADSDGYPPAHFWLAELMSADDQPLDAQQATVYQHHLSCAVEGMADSAEAHASLGLFFYAKDLKKQAIPHFETALDARPDLRLALAHCYVSDRRLEEGLSTVEDTIRYYREAVGREPEQEEHWIRWSSGLVFLERFEEAEDVLQDASAAEHTNNAQRAEFEAALVRTYVLWFDHLLTQPKLDLKLLKSIAKQGLEIDSECPLLQRIVRLAFSTGRRDLVSFLENAQLRDSAAALLEIGMIHIQRKEFDKAVTWLEQAYLREPGAPQIQNNLAWALTFASEPQLDRALELVDLALESDPKNPHLCDTRGQILVKMRRFDDALESLELALARSERNRQLHQALAETYNALGRPELAAGHERLAQ